jgi:hypothetical protein
MLSGFDYAVQFKTVAGVFGTASNVFISQSLTESRAKVRVLELKASFPGEKDWIRLEAFHQRRFARR